MGLCKFEASLESGLQNEMLSKKKKSFSYSANCLDTLSKQQGTSQEKSIEGENLALSSSPDLAGF